MYNLLKGKYADMISVALAIAIWQGALFFLVGLIRYNALVLLLSSVGQKQKKVAALACVLLWFPDVFTLLWMVDCASVADICCFSAESAIPLIACNSHVFNVKYALELPKKILTKKWWKRRRKVNGTIVDSLLFFAVFEFIGAYYFSYLGAVVWTAYIVCSPSHKRVKSTL